MSDFANRLKEQVGVHPTHGNARDEHDTTHASFRGKGEVPEGAFAFVMPIVPRNVTDGPKECCKLHANEGARIK